MQRQGTGTGWARRLYGLLAASASALLLVPAGAGAAPPDPPLLTTDPPSPSSSLTPAATGTVDDSATAVFVYLNGTCSGAADSAAAADVFEDPGFFFTPVLNGTTTISANAENVDGLSGCSSAVYVHDSIALAPAITATNPASGSDDNSPEVIGSAEAGSTVRIYVSGACSGAPLATGSQATFSSTGLTVSIPDNTTTALVADYTDQAGNLSPCSEPFTYTEVTQPAPEAPAAKKKCKKGRKLKKGKCVKKKRKKKK